MDIIKTYSEVMTRNQNVNLDITLIFLNYFKNTLITSIVEQR
jgi:hypothetical protein